MCRAICFPSLRMFPFTTPSTDTIRKPLFLLTFAKPFTVDAGQSGCFYFLSAAVSSNRVGRNIPIRRRSIVRRGRQDGRPSADRGYGPLAAASAREQNTDSRFVLPRCYDLVRYYVRIISSPTRFAPSVDLPTPLRLFRLRFGSRGRDGSPFLCVAKETRRCLLFVFFLKWQVLPVPPTSISQLK